MNSLTLQMNIPKILFERPQLQALTRGLMCVDMHTHSNYSDGLNKVPYILKRVKKEGIGISLTDHNTIFGSLEALKQKDALIIPGMEVNSYDGPHLLFYFYNVKEFTHFYEHNIKNYKNKNPNSRVNKTLLELYDISKQYNTVLSLAHPNGILWQNVVRSAKKNDEHYKVLRSIDALEVINGVQTRSGNKKAGLLAEELQKGMTGGSDAHAAMSIGSVVTCAEAQSVEEFLNAIKKKKTIVIGTEGSFHKRMLSHGTIIRKHARYVGTLMRDRIVIPNIRMPHFRKMR